MAAIPAVNDRAMSINSIRHLILTKLKDNKEEDTIAPAVLHIEDIADIQSGSLNWPHFLFIYYISSLDKTRKASPIQWTILYLVFW